MSPHELGLVLDTVVIAAIVAAIAAVAWLGWEAWARGRAALAKISCDWCSGVPGAAEGQCRCDVPCGELWCRKLTGASRG